MMKWKGTSREHAETRSYSSACLERSHRADSSHPCHNHLTSFFPHSEVILTTFISVLRYFVCSCYTTTTDLRQCDKRLNSSSVMIVGLVDEGSCEQWYRLLEASL